MKLICKKENRKLLIEKLKAYEDLDIVLVEYGESYEGMSYQFDINHLDKLVNYLKELKQRGHLIGYQNDRMYSVLVHDIVYIEGLSKECYFFTEDQEYLSEYKLYELEEKLAGTSIIRISKSMLVNICFIEYIQAEANMKYGLYMKNNIKLTLSRKYVQAFKKKIGKR